MVKIHLLLYATKKKVMVKPRPRLTGRGTSRKLIPMVREQPNVLLILGGKSLGALYNAS